MHVQSAEMSNGVCLISWVTLKTGGGYCPDHHPSNSKLRAGQGAPEGGRQGEWWKNKTQSSWARMEVSWESSGESQSDWIWLMWRQDVCHKNKILYEAKCLKCLDFKYIRESDRNLFTQGGEYVRNKSGFIAKHQEEKHNSEQAEFKWNPCV